MRPERENIARRFIEERYRLMPYLYTTTEEMSRTGVPILRPLFVEFPDATDDKHPMDVDTPNEFLFGPDILVAPAPYPDELDNYFVQLPPVTWYDYWTGAKLPPLPKLSSRDLEQPGAKEEMARLMAPFHVTAEPGCAAGLCARGSYPAHPAADAEHERDAAGAADSSCVPTTERNERSGRAAVRRLYLSG